MSNENALEFRRRSSSLATNGQTSASIILRPSIFRTNFRPSSLQARDYTKTRSKIIFFSIKKENCVFFLKSFSR